MSPPADLSFLAPPGDVADWRMTLLFDAVAASGVLTALPGTAEDLADSFSLDHHALRVTLDALGAWGIVERRPDSTYTLGPAAPTEEAALTLRHHARAIRGWSAGLSDRLQGITRQTRSPMPDPELFIDALAVNARKAAPALVDLCLTRFPAARSVVDLGGAHGEYSLEFARRGLKVTMQDMPTMIDIVAARGQLAAAGIELFAGSFFEEVPQGPFDLAFCCGVTHTFDSEHNLALYRRLRPVISPGGGVAVVTFLRGRHRMGDVFAVQMLANGSGGDSHSEDEYRDWLGAAGFGVDDEPIDIAGRPQSVLFAT